MQKLCVSLQRKMRFFVLVITLGFCYDVKMTSTHAKSVREKIETDSRLKETAKLLRKIERLGVQESDSGITVFLPSNEAWKKQGKARMTFFLEDENEQYLEDLLYFSLLEGHWSKETLRRNKTPLYSLLSNEAIISTPKNRICARSLNGESLTCTNVIFWDIVCDDGIIHIVDDVIYPETVLELATFPKKR